VGQEESVPECSKQNIFKCIACSLKNRKKLFTKIFPFFSHRISVISKKRSSFTDLPEYFQICPDMFQICPENFQVRGHMSSSPTPMSIVFTKSHISAMS